MSKTKVTCEGCGACCWDMSGSPPFIDDEGTGLPNDLKIELACHRAGLAVGAASRDARRLPCLWYCVCEANCAHYELRPQICRDMEIGGKDCLLIRKQMGIDGVKRDALGEVEV